MRNILLFVTALFVGSCAVIALPGDASAGPLPAMSAATEAAQLLKNVDYTRRYWRRYCRINGCDPDDMIAGPPVVAPRIVDQTVG